MNLLKMDPVSLLISIFILSFIFTYAVKVIALRKALLDVPNERSLHVVPKPRLGGIAVNFSWFAGLSYMYLTGKVESNLYYALLSGLPLVLIGLIDDIHSIKPQMRLGIQFIAAFLALYFLSGLQSIEYSSFKIISPRFLLNIIAFLAILWSINLFNFLDGIDGYIGSELVVIGIGTALLSGEFSILILVAATLGFLVWNWQPAKIFMGDTGSTMIGFSVAVYSIYFQNQGLITIPVFLILTSVFWFDATITLVRRIIRGEQLSQAHRKHGYQRIVAAGYSHQKTVIMAVIINLIGFGFALLGFNIKTYDIVFLALDVIVLSIIMFLIDKKQPFQ